MKARYGSIAVLLLASSSHSSRTAIQTAVTNGNRNRQRLQPIAPIRKNGLRRPHRGLQVRSDRAPVSVGVVDADRVTLPVPADLDLDAYTSIDLSVEPVDADPAHATSLAQGPLRP